MQQPWSWLLIMSCAYTHAKRFHAKRFQLKLVRKIFIHLNAQGLDSVKLVRSYTCMWIYHERQTCRLFLPSHRIASILAADLSVVLDPIGKTNAGPWMFHLPFNYVLSNTLQMHKWSNVNCYLVDDGYWPAILKVNTFCMIYTWTPLNHENLLIQGDMVTRMAR